MIGVRSSRRKRACRYSKQKKMAEVREQVDAAAKKLGLLHDGFRKKINEEVTSNFRGYLEANGFQVHATPTGAEGLYKDLKVNLVLPGPEERYFGIYHAFDLIVNGKKNHVRIVPDITGTSVRQAVRSGDALQLLEQDLTILIEEIANIKLIGYRFDCTQKGFQPGSLAVTKDTIAEVIDIFSA
ncbi:hypothetical protein J3P96_11940 [Pseudomonas sp. R3-56]|uniref:hypothetical protein n=1 Tax=Pseudomonas sp. R3-56 TaxID=2817401 RepID=UPI003DA9C8EC